MKTEDRERLAKEAGKTAREETRKALKRYKVTQGVIAKRLKEGLDAMETKAFLDKNSGEVVYSKPLIAHSIRLKAVEIGVSLLEMEPSKKVDLLDERSANPNATASELTDDQLLAIIGKTE